MASPFTIFRRYQKTFLAALALLAMIAFVFLSGPVFDSLTSSARQNPVVVRCKTYGDLTETEVANLLRQQNIVRSFFERVYAMMGFRIPVDPASEESAVETWLLASRARELGVVISNPMINTYLRQMTGDRFSREMFRQILGEMHISERQLFEALRMELAARQMLEMIDYSTLPATPAQRWDYYQRLNRRATVELVAEPVVKYLDRVGEPEEATLRDFFEKYKENPYDPSSPEPGFRRPHRVAVEYLKADIAKFIEPASITEEQIQQYYEKNKETYYLRSKLPPAEKTISPPSSSTEPTAPGKPSAEPQPKTPSPSSPDTKQPTSSESKPSEKISPDTSASGKPAAQTEGPKPSEPSSEKSSVPKQSSGEKTPDTSSPSPSPEKSPEKSAPEPPAEKASSEKTPAEQKVPEKSPAEKTPSEKPPAEKSAGSHLRQPDAHASDRSRSVFPLLASVEQSEEAKGEVPIWMTSALVEQGSAEKRESAPSGEKNSEGSASQSTASGEKTEKKEEKMPSSEPTAPAEGTKHVPQGASGEGQATSSASGGQQPGAEGGKPAPSNPPGDMVQPPESEKPVAGSEKPAVGNEKPAGGSEKAPVGGEKPTAGTEKPMVGEEKPAAGGEKPTAEKEKLGESKPEASAAEGAPSSASGASKYIPLEEVKEEIREVLARGQAQAKIEQMLQKIRDQMSSYSLARLSVPPDQEPPPPPNLEELAKQYGLEYRKTPLISEWQLYRDYRDIGQARIVGRESVVQFLYYQGRPPFQAMLAQDLDAYYLFWKVEDAKEAIPSWDFSEAERLEKEAEKARQQGDEQKALSLTQQAQRLRKDTEQIRQEVLRAWKMIQARSLARDRAGQLAALARKTGKPLREAFAKEPGVTVLEAGPFSWLTHGTVSPRLFMQAPPPRISPVPQVEMPGEEFMQTVFRMEPGQVEVAFNQPQTVAYVIRVQSFEPSWQVLWSQFVSDRYEDYSSAAIYDQQKIRRALLEQIKRQAGFQWERKPYSRPER